MEEYVLEMEEFGLIPGGYVEDKLGTVWKITSIEFALNRERLIPYLHCRTENPETGQTGKRSFAIGKNSLGRTVFPSDGRREDRA